MSLITGIIILLYLWVTYIFGLGKKIMVWSLTMVSLIKQWAPYSQRFKSVLFHQRRISTILGTQEVATEVENAFMSTPMNRDHQKSAVSRQSASVQSVSHFKDINLSRLSQSHRALLWWHQDGGAYWARASGIRDVLISDINAEGEDRRISHLNKVSEHPKVWVV